MKRDKKIFELIDKETHRQSSGVELIASENYVSAQVQKAQGSVLTNKYAEGLPGKRYYGGCEVVDEIEQMAIDRVKELFGAEWANVQPHSGAQANMAVMFAFLKPGDKILGFDLSHGGHLTHGSSVNFSGKLFQPAFYGVEKETGLIDFDKLADIAEREKPKMIICGASAYSRDWDYVKLRAAADRVGAVLMADIAHPAGLIARGLLNDPIQHCHVVTSTTHKTLRGPRGGIILVGKNVENPLGITTAKGEVRKLGAMIDSSVFPGIQGGPLEHVIAAKAIAFGEALSDDYMEYIVQVAKNAKAMAKTLTDLGYHIISGGTDNHLMLIDLTNKKLTGKLAVEALTKADITINKNMVPFDTLPPMVASGIRIGSPAITTRGFKEKHVIKVVELIDEALHKPEDDKHLKKIKGKVNELTKRFPLFGY